MLEALNALDELNSEQISTSPLFSIILPNLLAHAGFLEHAPVAEMLEVVCLIQQLIERIGYLHSDQTMLEEEDELPKHSIEHLVVVESNHPYTQVERLHRHVRFSNVVNCLGVEFDPRSQLSQPEDTLVIWVRKGDAYFVEFISFSGDNPFPNSSILLPGNEAIFDLQTASDYQVSPKKGSFSLSEAEPSKSFSFSLSQDPPSNKIRNET